MAIRKKYATLGRGLDALMGAENVSTGGSGSINEVPVDRIVANPNQPRRDFDEGALEELSASIRELGIVQPITLRDQGDGTFLIVAGERRWRASQMAGLKTVPAYIRTVSDENMMEMALIENIQREDLNSMEIALAYQNLMERYGLTQERLSVRVGKNRSTVTNYLRLLKLPATIQLALKRRELEMGHARALLSLDDARRQLEMYERIKSEGLSVRAVEQAVRDVRGGMRRDGGVGEARRGNGKLAQEYRILRDSLCRFFQTKVQLACSDKGKGKITIPFANEAEMIRIIELLDRLK